MIIGIDYTHAKIHAGSAYVANFYASAVANGATKNLHIKAGTKAVHLIATIDVSANFTMKTYSGNTYTVDGTAPDGTSLTVFNRIIGGDSMTATVKHTATVDELGTLRGMRLIPGGSGPKTTGSSSGERMETIIPPGKDLYFLFTCGAGDGQTGDLTLVLDWYEDTAPETETDLDDVKFSAITLKELDDTAITLTPTFAEGTFTYTAGVEWAETFVKIAGTEVPSTAWTRGLGTKPLVIGENVLYVEGYKEGMDPCSYKFTVTRKDLARGKTFSILNGEEELVDFDDETFAYTGSVGSTITTLAVTGTAVDADDTVTFSANVVSDEVTLVAGPNTITMTVEDDESLASDGVYTAIITKETLQLASLTVGEAVTLEAYDYTYTVNVANEIDSIAVSAAAGEGVTVTWSAEVDEGNVTLSVGSNVITATLSAEDEANAVYTITIVRAAE